MGKDRLLWGRSASKRHKNKGFERERGPPTGCMGSMFQLLNFSNVKSDYFIEDHPIPTKEKTGLDAPRNSLEEEEPVKAKENSLMPVSIRIKTCGGISKNQDNKTSDDLSLAFYALSPSPNTPNLVARLMGLNHLPENLSPSLPSLNPSKLSKADQKELMYQRNHSINSRCSFDIDITGSRSLPESPRVSVSRKSDVEHHRLSLQSCKEDVSGSGNIKSQRKNKNVRQENVCKNLGRKFGMDISNTTIGNKEHRRDHVLLANPKKPLEKKSPENQVLNLSLQGVKNKKENVKKKTESFENKHFGQSTKRIEKPSNMIGRKKEENFARRSKENRENKSKKTPILSVTPVFPVKKEPLAKTKLVSKQESEAHFSKRRTKSPSCLVKPYYNPQMTCHKRSSGVTNAQFHYIIEVLKFLDIDQNSAVLVTKLRSPSHPLHPSVFNFLDLTFSGSIDTQLRHRCNRKLIFELVDEILVDVLNPYLNLKPWLFQNTRNVYQRDGFSLISQLLTKIQSLHATDCRVLEDIDRLIDKDFDRSNFRILVAFEEESETIVAKLESDIMDSLVHDIVFNVLFNRETVHEW